MDIDNAKPFHPPSCWWMLGSKNSLKWWVISACYTVPGAIPCHVSKLKLNLMLLNLWCHNWLLPLTMCDYHRPLGGEPHHLVFGSRYWFDQLRKCSFYLECSHWLLADSRYYKIPHGRKLNLKPSIFFWIILFKLCNALETLQRVMQKALAGLSEKCVATLISRSSI